MDDATKINDLWAVVDHAYRTWDNGDASDEETLATMRAAARGLLGIAPFHVTVGEYFMTRPKVRRIAVKSLAEARAACREWIEAKGVGASDWAGGEVTDADGECVAVVSYNGRVWEPGGSNPEGLRLCGEKEIQVSA